MTERRAAAVGVATLAVCLVMAGCSCSRPRGITKAEAQRRADGAERAATEGFAQLWPGLQSVARARRALGEFSQCTDQGGDVLYAAKTTLIPEAGSTPAQLADRLRAVLGAAGWQITPGISQDTVDRAYLGGRSGDLVAAISVQPDIVFVDVLSPCVEVGKHDDVGFEGTKDLELP